MPRPSSHGGADVLAAVERALVEHFGSRPSRASVSFVGVEPLEILRFEPIPGERAYVSLGMSRRPMTAAAETAVTESGPRAELMLHLRDPADEYADVWRSLAVLAAAPAVEGVVHQPGMTVDLGGPLAPGSRCIGVVTADSSLPPLVTPAGDVAVIHVVPATATELAWCRVHGSTALTERWRRDATDLLDLTRQAVALD
jgi:hypothetical protein